MQPTPFHSARQLGAVVRSTRERDGWSQSALAKHAAVERQWLVLFENGKLDNPTLGNVFKVVDALGMHLQVAGRDDETAFDSEPDLSDLMGRS